MTEADTNVLYDRIRKENDTLSYTSSVSILNDLSHSLVPVDP